MGPSLRHHWFIALAAACLCLFHPPPAGAGEAALPSAAPEFLIDNWTSDDGLPQNSVIAMAQTTDGYLWLSTYGGLARFDGRRFDVFDGDEIPELSGDIFTSIRADTKGRLWLKGVHNRLVVGLNGHFRRLGVADGLPPSGATALEIAANGEIFIGDDKGRLLKYEKDRFIVVKDTAPTPDWGKLDFMAIDEKGIVWTWRRARCARLVDGKWSVIVGTNGGNRINTFRVARDGSGALMLLNGPNMLQWYSNGRITDIGPVPKGVSGAAMDEDASGDLWLSTPAGVMRREPNGRWTELPPGGGFPPDEVRCSLVDREGNRWLGTDGGGLVRLKRRDVRSFGMKEGMNRKVALSVAGEGANSIWVVALGRALNHFDGSRFTLLAEPQVLGWCVRTTRAGQLWLGTYNAELYLLDASRTVRRSYKSILPQTGNDTPIVALFESSGGDLWIGTDGGGLLRCAEGQFHTWTTVNGLANNHVNAIEEDRSGAIWVGTEGGLNRLQGADLKTYRVADGLAGAAVRSIFCDSQGTLWIGGHELTRFKDGRFSAVRAANGLPVNNIKAIAGDNQGCLWFATPHGILRARRRPLNELCDTGKGRAEFLVLTKADGLPSNECSGNEPAVWKGPDGRLWFATLNGIAVIDPKHLAENKVPPPVAIEAVVADDQALALPFNEPGAGTDADPVRIPAGTLRLDFRFAALSFTAPEKNRFRYRMEGFDPDWIEAGTSQAASYTRLPPGRYSFHVLASNNDGVWNESGAALALNVLPMFWQTNWFRFLVAGAAAGLICWIFCARRAQFEQRRLAQEAFARQIMETQEAERQRIARELHDGVGQVLLLVKNRLSLGIKKMEPSSPVLDHFGQAATDVTQAIAEIRATAHALRPVELDRLGLGQALASMLERAGGATTTRISSELEDVRNSVGREVEIQLYRIAQEAINNVLKHSNAREVNVALKPEGGRLVLAVQDDGVGFDPALSGRKRGFGLSGMAERARLIGGVLSVMAAPGKGCRLTVSVPLLKEPHE